MKSYFANEVPYVVDISNEVEQLETELKAIDREFANGTMSVEQAQKARERVINRLDAINNTITNASSDPLTPELRVKLDTALTKLSWVLTTYKDSLVKVDTIAGPAKVTKLNARGGRSNSTIADLILDTAQSLEEHISEVTGDDAIPEDEIFDENQVNETPSNDNVPEASDDVPEETEVNEDNEVEDSEIDEEITEDTTTIESTTTSELEVQ